jgi:hypothetical protein
LTKNARTTSFFLGKWSNWINKTRIQNPALRKLGVIAFYVIQLQERLNWNCGTCCHTISESGESDKVITNKKR